ncbi:MAG: class II aldolase/adducin family protein [Caldilinea sp.]|uniref:class II aldolase/adducin family protein n=1 Tax=Caldilinea sp. TaxID=2293560 RepID=UPI0030A75F88
MNELLHSLVKLSHELGREERQLAILGEGNTSARIDENTFWVKASGSQLGTIAETGFTQVKMDAILALVERDHMSQEEVQAIWPEVMVDPQQKRPSVETFLHALCLSEGGASWVAHTHPISCNAILCSRLGAEPFLRHLFPDGIVVCGRYPAVVPYVDPGFELAKAVRAELRRYQDAHGVSPKLLLMVNHGITALGRTMQEALNITLMADKWARILLGTYALGGPNYMPDEEAARIDNRLDEHYRRRQLAG